MKILREEGTCRLVCVCVGLCSLDGKCSQGAKYVCALEWPTGA